MKQIAIFVCGAPVTGKTTTTNALKEFFEQAGTTVQVISRQPNTGYDATLTNMDLNIYKWRNEKSSEILLIDGPGLTVYDREVLLKGLKDITTVAIWHNRSHIFMYNHNNDHGHSSWNDRSILARANMDQQPIQREGFKVVYHVGGTSYLDLPGFIANLNIRAGTKYPIPEKPSEGDVFAPDPDGDSADTGAAED
ncbi:hypothetical protein [uncultured Duncaniella sp.]|uniref:hypothetical protein n=1 Tax=uncultured Duncaniella sp. TaxID=2768039 RepID=UPI002635F400|nr:hypothetical protein [uncultured Duncaniella sp.]